MKILYLHGIGSGANSGTAGQLRKFFPEAEVLAPELPISPKKAYEMLMNEYYDDEDIDLVVGTSLGGFYAMTLWLKRKLLINPAMFADEDIRKGIGLGTQKIWKPRSDGASTYVIDEQFISELSEIRKKIYNNRDMMHPEKLDVNECNSTWAAFATDDDLVRHYDTFCKLLIPDHAIHIPGGHHVDDAIIDEYVLPFAKKILETPEPPLVFVYDDFSD